MKKLLTFAVAALMVLATVGAASAAVEARGTVTGDNFTWNAQNFPGFWYDIDDDVSSETLMINQTAGVIAEEEDLVYTATAVPGQTPEFDFTESDTSAAPYEYQKLGLFAEEYFVVAGANDTLSKILMDDDSSYTLRTGETLELEEGYALTPQQIDVDGNKVWLELTKDGDFVEDKIISTADATQANKTWFFEQDVGDQEDVATIIVHVDEVFQGQVDSLCVVEGVFQISEDPLILEVDDEFGELIVTSVDGPVVLKNTEELDIPEDDVLELTDGLSVRGNEDASLWYLFTEYTEPGTYELRGSVASADFTWNAQNFPSFWYDIDENVSSETLLIDETAGVLAEEAGVVYTATAVPGQTPEFDFTESDTSAAPYEYQKLGLFAEEYFVVAGANDTLSKILMDDDSSYTLRTGETLELEEGYALTPQQIDVDGNKVWLELTKDGDFVEDKIISTADATQANKTWFFEQDVGDQEDVATIIVHVDEVFQGQVDSLCVVEGVFQISEDPLILEVDDEFGELIVTSVDGPVVLKNTEELDIPDDDTLELTDRLMVLGNDGANRWYLFTEETIEGDEAEEEPEEPEEPEVEEPEVPEEPEEPEGNVTEPEMPEEPETPEGNETPEEPEEPGTPGFEAVLAIGGLLAVAYLVRRN